MKKVSIKRYLGVPAEEVVFELKRSEIKAIIRAYEIDKGKEIYKKYTSSASFNFYGLTQKKTMDIYKNEEYMLDIYHYFIDSVTDDVTYATKSSIAVEQLLDRLC